MSKKSYLGNIKLYDKSDLKSLYNKYVSDNLESKDFYNVLKKDSKTYNEIYDYKNLTNLENIINDLNHNYISSLSLDQSTKKHNYLSDINEDEIEFFALDDLNIKKKLRINDIITFTKKYNLKYDLKKMIDTNSEDEHFKFTDELLKNLFKYKVIYSASFKKDIDDYISKKNVMEFKLNNIDNISSKFKEVYDYTKSNLNFEPNLLFLESNPEYYRKIASIEWKYDNDDVFSNHLYNSLYLNEDKISSFDDFKTWLDYMFENKR